MRFSLALEIQVVTARNTFLIGTRPAAYVYPQSQRSLGWGSYRGLSVDGAAGCNFLFINSTLDFVKSEKREPQFF